MRGREPFMEYRTAKETAKQWNISERLVQRYCAQGRIEGARKFGTSWGIPVRAVKPSDPRKEPRAEYPSIRLPLDPGLMPLMNTPFLPGCCREAVDAMEDGAQKEIALAEYWYFTGQAERAAEQVKPYLSSSDAPIRLSACLIYTYASLPLGEIDSARLALKMLRQEASREGADPALRAASGFAGAAAAVLLHLPLPEELPPVGEFLPLLPPGLRAFSLYVQAHRLYLRGEYGKSVGVVEATLAMGAERYPIPAVYLHLVAVMDYMSMKQLEEAQRHLLAAWQLAEPDDLIEGFAEHHGLLGGMLEAVIKPGWPEQFKRMIAITYRFSAGWRRVHNPVTGHDVADNLTTTEFAVAMLAARGWTNQEIGLHMNLSPHTVKQHVSIAMQKLGVERRRDLKRYMLL